MSVWFTTTLTIYGSTTERDRYGNPVRSAADEGTAVKGRIFEKSQQQTEINGDTTVSRARAYLPVDTAVDVHSVVDDDNGTRWVVQGVQTYRHRHLDYRCAELQRTEGA